MAETKTLTQEQADALINATGLVIHPGKGEQGPRGGWRCTGYAVDPDGQVTSLKLESVAQTGDVGLQGEVKDPKTGERSLGIVGTIPSHPLEVRAACNPRHFRPAREMLEGKPKVVTPEKVAETTPKPAPVAK